MPTYTYRCPACGDADRVFPMGDVPASVACATCGADAPRRYTPVGTTSASPLTAARDAAARTAYEPAVVSAPPPAASRRQTSTNPLHAKLPRP